MAGFKGIQGRKPKTEQTAEINQQLRSAAVLAAQHLYWSVRGKDSKGHKFPRLSGTRIKECELVIAHAIGTPRQKIDMRHSGDLLTLRDLAELAYKHPELLPEPQDIVEGEIINQYNREEKGEAPAALKPLSEAPTALITKNGGSMTEIDELIKQAVEVKKRVKKPRIEPEGASE